MVYPLVELTRGHIKSRSVFCQISGFFLTLGIEACDVSVVLIAVHTAMFIVNGGGNNGLYPYRRIAYAAYTVLPLFLAALAFINEPGYVNSGEYCYLPMRSGWSRQALSWIPRYVIFSAIIILYACVYVYVSFAVTKYGNMAHNAAIPSSDGHSDRRRRRSSVPKMPKLSYHGLLPPTPDSSRRSSISRRDSLLTSIVPDRAVGDKKSQNSKQSNLPRPQQTIKWKPPNFGLDSAYSTDPAGTGSLTLDTTAAACHLSRTPEVTPLSEGQAPLPSPTSQVPADREPALTTSNDTRAATASFWNRSLTMSNTQRPSFASLSNIMAMLRHGSRDSSSSAPSVLLTPRTMYATGMQQTREEIKRQARCLFVYPLVYIIVWLMPFVAHILRGRGSTAPFPVDLLSLASLCIQGAVDALVFSLRERPWRVSEEDSASRPIPWWKGRRSRAFKVAQPGRTREEMLRDGRLARRRLEDEIAEKRMELLARRSATVNWWDVSGPARTMGSRHSNGGDYQA